MSSQNYLSNVFRQVYTYSNGQFIPTLNISNVSKITADSLTVTTLSLGGTNDNLYFGDGAGSINANSRDNVAIGVAAANNISNTSNSVFLGRSAGAGVDGADTMISIGMGAKGNGISNIYIGKDTGAAAASSSNIFIGHSLDTSLAISNTLLIGQDGDTLITGNFSNKWLGIGTSTPTSGYKFDVSGNTNIKGALNVTGNLNAGSLSVSAVSAPYSRLSNGTVLEPSYSFVNDTSMGMYMVASNTIGFAYAGQQSMCISGSLVGINTPTPRTALDVSGDISANRYNGPNGTASAPKYTFSSDLSTGVFLASNGALSFTAGGVKQLTITSNGVVNDNPSAVTTNPILRDYVTPINYDISGGNILVTKTVSASNFTGIASASNSIGGVTLSNSNVSGVVTTTTSNVLANGYLRNALIPTQFDISGGNISNSGTTRSSNFMTASSSSSNVIGGITMSSGRIAAGTTTSNYIGGITLSNFSIITNPTTSNTIGGVILSNNNIALDGAITGTTANTSNQIGGVILSNSNVSFGGAITGTTANTSNNIGGITLSNNNIAMSGTIVGSTANTSNNIGGITLSNNNIAMSGTIVGSTANTSNNIGGVTLSNNNISNSGQLTSSNIRVGGPPDTNVYAIEEFGGGYDNNGTGVGASPAMAFQYRSGSGGFRHFIRARHDAQPIPAVGNALDFFINGTNTSNGSSAPGTGNVLALSVTATGVGVGTSIPAFNLDVSGNIRSTLASSNNIGGITLSNNNIAMSGTLIGSTANTSNNIGGVTLSNNNIAMSGTIVGSTANTSNNIGGVTLSNNNISNSGQLTSSNVRVQAGASNVPTYAFTSDPSAGLFAPNVGTLAFATGGLQRMCISSTNVGIGTAQPTSRLVVSDSSGSFIIGAPSGSYPKLQILGPAFANPNPGSEFINAEITLAAAGTSSYANCIRSINLGGGAYADCNRMGFFTMLAGGDSVLRERMSILPNGNIGIGATTPITRLHVYNTTNDATHGLLCIENNGGFGFPGGINTGTSMTFKSQWASDNGSTSVVMGKIDAYKETNFNYGDSYLAFSTRYETNRGGGGVGALNERMRLSGLGYLGIGTTVPGHLLDVNGGQGGTTTIRVYSGSDVAGSATNIPRIRLTSRVGTGAILDYDITGEEVNTTNNYGLTFGGYSSANVFRMDFGNKRLGIGTVAPAYALDVSAGTTAASINMSSWPRVNGSTSLFATCSSRIGSILIFTTGLAMNTDIVELTNSASLGSYFVVKKAGIYSVTSYVTGGAANTWNHRILGNTVNSSTDMFVAGATVFAGGGNLNSIGESTLTYVGYLPANTNYFYKIGLSTGLGAGTTSKLVITFLYETPALTGFYV
jgi:hypothetical protein